MSVFRVRLQTPPSVDTTQGYLDYNPTGANACTNYLGQPFDTSIQRTMFCAGPNRIYRELVDGAVFTDCNYWTRFDVAADPSYGFIEVLFNDGSVYSDIPGENTFPVIYSPYTVNNTDTFATNFIDIIGSLGSAATFVQLTNNGTSSTQNVSVQLNGSSMAVFTLGFGDTQVFNAGDLTVTKLAFQGGSASTTLQIILSLTVQCTS